jgi:hypothetical protein
MLPPPSQPAAGYLHHPAGRGGGAQGLDLETDKKSHKNSSVSSLVHLAGAGQTGWEYLIPLPDFTGKQVEYR